MSMCRSFLRSISSSIVALLRLTLMRSGTTMHPSSIHASPTTSRLERGGMRISSSPAYCERHFSDAPRSTWPTAISKMVGMPAPVPEYCTATSRLVVVDKNANSTPPRHPKASVLWNASGSIIPPRPRNTVRPFGSFSTWASLRTPETIAWRVVTYLLPRILSSTFCGKPLRTALYFMNIGPVYSRSAINSTLDILASWILGSLSNFSIACRTRLWGSFSKPSFSPGYSPASGATTNSHSRREDVSSP
mmetsp:Transcript_17017/g.41055  ORF Transcript_17017/g.41055 Transcript_17017/m.41055 type:complete len:248 (-) Transcript_17017:491-1234(-)